MIYQYLPRSNKDNYLEDNENEKKKKKKRKRGRKKRRRKMVKDKGVQLS